MRVQKKNKAFAYRVPIGDYNYLQCKGLHTVDQIVNHSIEHPLLRLLSVVVICLIVTEV